MKRAILVLAGFFPLLLGYLVNHLTMTVWYYQFLPGVLMLIGIGVLLLWAVIGAVAVKFFESRKETVILLNAIPALFMLLISFQTIFFERFWLNTVGVATQFFYLPLMGLISHSLAALALPIIDLMMVAIVALGFMVLFSWLGTYIGREKEHRQRRRRR